MAANSNRVVSLRHEDAGPKSMSKPESLAMLSTCRDLAADLLSKSLTAMLDKIEESLFNLADGAAERDMQNLYMQARGEAQAKRTAIEVEFRRQFVDGFNRTMRGERKEKSGFDQLDLESVELSLVGPQEQEEELTATNIATQLKNACGDELLALNQRIGSLMSLPDVDSAENPMSPQAIVEAFRAACKQIESDLNVRLLVLKQFEQIAGDNVSNVYQDMNQFLIKRNILPTLPKAGVARRRAAPSGARTAGGRQASFGSAEQAGAAYAQQAGQLGGEPGMPEPELPSYAVGNEQELLATLQQLLALNQVMQSHPAMAPGAMAGVGQGAAAPNLQSAPAVASMHLGAFNGNLGQSFLDALNLLQQGNPAQALTDLGDLDLAALINGNGNVLHQIKTTSLANSLGHLDAMTIDIVAMLFDYIFDDKNIPAPMKALIGRLQIPVLKVAMLDNKFFARKSHPTRKLLDTLSVAALGWQEADGLDDRLYRKIASLVDQIVVGFDENIGIFETTLTELESFLNEEEHEALAVSQGNAESLAAEEQRELAAAMASQVVSERLALPEMPDIIRSFLVEQWQPVLVHVALKAEHADEAWRNAVQAMDDLVWSVAPKVGAEERLRLVNLLPRLLKQLEVGTQDAGVERSRRESFFSELVQAHAHAIKSGLKHTPPPAPVASVPVPAGAVAASSAPPRPVTPIAVPAPVAEVKHILPSVVMSAPAAGSQHLLGDLPPMEMEQGLASFEVNNLAWDAGLDKYSGYDDVVGNQLKKGAWVEFKQKDGQTSRAKLAWVSPRKSRYLFTNRQGQNGLEYTLAELVALFKRGDASLIEGGPLVERAVSDMIDMLQPARA